MTLTDVFDQIEAALQAPEDERAHHARQALQALPDDHPAREPLADGLAGDLDLVTALRTAYGQLPPGPDDDLCRHNRKTTEGQLWRRNRSADRDEPPVGIEWIDEDRAVLGLELTRPVIEWIELEMDDDAYGIASWIRRQIYVQLQKNLRVKHGFTAGADVDVPEDYARRVSLWARDRRIQGDDVDAARIETFVFNHMTWEPTWQIEGEPWDLVEEDDVDD